MYTDSPSGPMPSIMNSTDSGRPSSIQNASPPQNPDIADTAHMAVFVNMHTNSPNDDSISPYEPSDTEPLIGVNSNQSHDDQQPCISTNSSAPSRPHEPSSLQIRTNVTTYTHSSSISSPPLSPSAQSSTSSSSIISTDYVDRYMRIINAWYLIWFILGSVWVSDGGECSKTAPHLYQLIVVLTIIYYVLLFLPLACFCLIVCCLPLFILVYRIMLPYAERERRRARAADPVQVQNLSSIAFSPANFAAHTGTDSLEDASCVICLCEYENDEVVRFLPCKHHFHKHCVDIWLRMDKACCLCKQDIDAQTQPMSSPV